MPTCVPIPDYKVEVRRLDAVEELSFPGNMSRIRITIDRVKVVLLHAMKNLISRTRVGRARKAHGAWAVALEAGHPPISSRTVGGKD